MRIHIIKPCSPLQRETLEPHLEAYYRLQRIVTSWAPEPGCKFDMEALCWYREEADDIGGNDAGN